MNTSSQRVLIVLAITLGLSVVLNFVVLQRLPRPPVTDTVTQPSETVTTKVDLSAVTEELESLRAEIRSIDGGAVIMTDLESVETRLDRLQESVSALREQIATIGAPDAKPTSPAKGDSGIPDVLANDPELQEMLAAQQGWKETTKELMSLYRMRKSLEETKYNELAGRILAGYLDLRPEESARFNDALKMAMDEYDAIEKQQREWYKANPKGPNEDHKAYNQRYQEFYRSSKEQQEQVARLFNGLLNDSARHDQFRQNLRSYFYYIRPKENLRSAGFGH